MTEQELHIDRLKRCVRVLRKHKDKQADVIISRLKAVYNVVYDYKPSKAEFGRVKK